MEALVFVDRRITVEAIVEKVKICHGSVFNILHDILNMIKGNARAKFRDCLHPLKKKPAEPR